MVKIKENVFNLKELEEAAYYHIRTFNEYASDFSIEVNDYSCELLLQQALFHLQVFKRAVTRFKGDELIKINNNLELFLKNTFSEQKESFRKKYSIFELKYYSKDRIEKLLTIVKNKIEADINKVNIEDDIHLLLEIKDGYDLRINKSFSFDWLTNFNTRIFELKDNLNRAYSKNYFLFNYFYESVDSYRNAQLIPKTEDCKWWFTFKPITSTLFKKNYNEMIMNELGQKALLSVLSTNMTGKLKKLKKNLVENVNWISEKSKEAFSEIIEVYKPKQVQPVYATYGKKEDLRSIQEQSVPIREDFVVPHQLIQDNTIINQTIIEDLIELIQESDEVDEIRRKEILATAYLIIGKIDIALKLLENDD